MIPIVAYLLEAHGTTNNTDDDHEQSLEMVRVCDENVRGENTEEK